VTEGSSGPAATDPLVASRDQFLTYVRARVSDRELAEDIVQDSLLRAVRAAPELRDEQRLIPWFYRILQNAIIDAYRRRAARQTYLPTTDLAGVEEELPAPTPEAQAALCECFRRLLPTLKTEYGELIESLDLGDESPEAAAGRLGITPNNLKVRRHRARQALRKRLEETCRTCATHGCLDCTCTLELANRV
jgi:RNA polymerase sigma-70 factor (ECF subfamily)